MRNNIKKNPEYNTQQGIAKALDRFNLAAKKIIDEINVEFSKAKKGQISFVDITQLTREGATKNGKPDKSLFADDGIHYSGKMYEKCAEKFLPVAEQCLGPVKGDWKHKL